MATIVSGGRLGPRTVSTKPRPRCTNIKAKQIHDFFDCVYKGPSTTTKASLLDVCKHDVLNKMLCYWL